MIEPNPFYTLIQIAGGYSLPRCLHVVADLGVADVLDETPRTPADLAASVGGGGRDHLLRAVLDSAPTAKGVLFDLPHVLEEAADVASERLTLQPGDFFKDSVPICGAWRQIDTGADISILEALPA